MKLHTMSIYTFEATTLALLHAGVNKFLAGQSVTSGETGTVAYAADESRGKEFIGADFRCFSGKYQLVIYYGR